MKKTLFSALGAAALLVTGCTKDADVAISSGNEQNVSISVAMADVAGTRAITAQGTGSNVNRAILEIYTNDNGAQTLYKRMVAPVSSYAASFDLRLVTSQTYDFVVWADCASGTPTVAESYTSVDDTELDNHYETNDGGLMAITIKDYTSITGSDETRDAFFGSAKEVKISSAETLDITLKRPFGQLNISTDLTDVASHLLPKYVKTTYITSTATTFNAYTAGVADAQTNAWSDKVEIVDYASVVSDATGIHLSTDYILAPISSEKLIDFEVEFFDASGNSITTNTNFANIPIKRNFRTNVSGELLTADGKVNVLVDQLFDGSSDVNVTGSVTVATVDEANAFLASFVGTDNVNITIGTVTDPETIAVPSSVTGNVTFVVEGVAGTPVLTVTTETAGDVTIDNQSGTAMGLDVTAKNASVYVDGSYNSLSVLSKPNTTYIAEGAVVDALTVNQGNVVLYGEAQSIVRGSTTDTIELTAYGTLGTIGEGVELVDGTILYNVTQKEQKADFSDLINYSSADDVVFVGAGKHYLIANTGHGAGSEGQIQKSVKMYGPNKGVVGTSTERKAEAQIASMVYCAPTGDYKLDIEIDGVEFVEDAGFSIEGGSDVVLKNSIISSTAVNMGSELDRIFYTNATRMSSNITIENNLFKAADGSALQMRIMGQRFNTSENNYTTYGNCPTVLVMTGNEFHNYNITMGAYAYISGAESSFTVTGNTFYNSSATETVLDLYDASGDADAYSHFTVSGNTFNEGQVGINVGFVPQNYDPFETSAIELANTFNDVDVNVVTPKFYNMTTSTSYADYDTLIDAVAANDVVYVGSGDYEMSTSFGKNVTIYGANKGVAGDSAERKAETRFIAGKIYKAPTNVTSATITLAIDGVELTADFKGIELQGGGTFTLKNSKITDINTVSVGTSSTRFFYTDCSRVAGNFVFENNYFALGGGIKEFWAYGNKYVATKYDCPIALTVKGNVFDNMYLNLGISTNGDGQSFVSNMSVENNTFRNISSTNAIWLTPSSGVTGSTMFVNGNTFEDTVTVSHYVYVNGTGTATATTISGNNIPVA